MHVNQVNEIVNDIAEGYSISEIIRKHNVTEAVAVYIEQCYIIRAMPSIRLIGNLNKKEKEEE